MEATGKLKSYFTDGAGRVTSTRTTGMNDGGHCCGSYEEGRSQESNAETLRKNLVTS